VISEDVTQQLAEKDQEIKNLNLILELKETQIASLSIENEKLKEQLSLTNDTAKLKQTIHALDD
jgi:regulator of replication initiation timing